VSGRALAGRVYVALALAFLYLPVAVMAAMSFNASPLYQLPFRFTTDWYAKLAGNARLLEATWNSIWIALVTTVLATALGTMAAVGLMRYRGRGRRALGAALFPPIAIPWLIIGVAMLMFFFLIGLDRGAPAVLLGHVALAIPYVAIVVGARLRTLPPELEEAARSLGAGPVTVLRRVTLPWAAPGIVAGALFAFAVSFDQFVVSYFLATPGRSTLPVEIYTAIRKGFTPEVNAVSTVVIAVSMAAMLVAARLGRFGGGR
jgi:spermidine/putrescine transport system permease protein